jgi:hypothetical protein
MSKRRNDSELPLTVVQVLAKVGSIASITLLVMLFLGDAFNPSQISRTEWIGLFFFPIGVVAGMVIAWWKEGLGSALTLGSLAGFYIVYGYIFRNHIGGWWFVIFASPGFLFLLHWLLRVSRHKHAFGHTI